MKDENQVFVSYGHVEEEMCKDICAYLSGNGFKPWVDTSKLQHGMLWRDEIRKGIEDSGQVVALLSAYSTRDRGVCLDEISIAVGVTGGNIHTILLQEENIINVPPTIGFEQWFDMSDWKKKKAEGDQAYNEWFKAKMDDVIRRLRDPEHVEKYGQITELRMKLNVQYAVGRQQKLLNEHYTGRKWLGEKIDAWLEDPNAPRRCLVTGAPGVGKSAFAVHYAHYNPKTAAALFFSADMPNYNDPCVVIQTLAYLLACRLSAYRKSLLWELNQEDRTTLAKLTEKELFDKLITRPLSQAINGDHPAMCIILDGLEECGDPQKNTLAKTIARYADSLPWWLHILIVARDVPAVKNYTKNALRIELCGEDQDNLEDIRAYYREALEEKFGSDPAWPETLEQITVRSQGIFLYAKMLTSLLLDKGTLDVGGDYPGGLSEVFTLWFDWFFPDGEDYARRWRLPIGCVLGSPDPIPAQTLRRVFDWSENELADFEARLSILLRKGKNVFGDETLVFDHDFVKEWLSSVAGENFYFSSPEDGRKKMAHALYAVFEEDAEELTYWEAVQLDALMVKKRHKALYENDAFCRKIGETGSYYATWEKLDKAETIFRKLLDEVNAVDKPTQEMEDIRTSVLCALANALSLKGESKAALELFEEAQEIKESTAKKDADEKNIADLSMIMLNKALLYLRNGGHKNIEKAMTAYKKGVNILEKNFPNSRNEYVLQALCSCRIGIGSVLQIVDDDDHALEIFLKCYNEWMKNPEEKENLNSLVGRANACIYVGTIYGKKEQEEAKIYYENAVAILKDVVRKRGTPRDKRQLAFALHNLWMELLRQDEIEETERIMEEECSVRQEILKENHTPQTCYEAAVAYWNKASFCDEPGCEEETLQYKQKAVALMQDCLQQRGINKKCQIEDMPQLIRNPQ